MKSTLCAALARLGKIFHADVASSFTSFEKPLTLRHYQLQSHFNGRFVADGVREEGGLQHQGGPWTCQIWFDLSGVNICTLKLVHFCRNTGMKR